MNISLDWYKVFYEVAKAKNITDAAHKLYISQPAVSQIIKQLEEKINTNLFIRTQKGVILTKEGEVLYKYISEAIEKISLGEKKLEEHINLENGEIRIGSSDMCLKYYLLKYLEQFQEKYPKIKISITNCPTPETIKLLEEDKIDFGLISEPFKVDNQFKVIKVCQIEDVFICGEKYKKVSENQVKLEELNSYPGICLEENTSTRKYINKYFESNNIEYAPKYELATSDLIVDFTKRNFGIGCVVDKFAQQAIKNKEVYKIDVEKQINPRHICIIKKEKLISRVSEELLRFINDKENL